MRERISDAATAVVSGLVRSTVFAACAAIVPALVAVLPVLAAFRFLGSPWSWSNPWSWAALTIITAAITLALCHPVAALFRRLIARWTGARIADGYAARPEPVRLSTGYWWNGSSYERSLDDARTGQRMRRALEPAYWRAARWSVVAAVVVLPVCGAPVVALVAAIVLIIRASALSVTIGLVLVVVSACIAPSTWRVVRPLAQRLLTPPQRDTASARDLREQRADLTAAHDAEIRRIERDLHDGAQSRLVAVGLDIAAAERLVDADPDRARELLRSARTGTADSLNSLRELVRGVYPPVLVERGLVPALRALALDGPVPVEIEGPDALRIPSPLAAALYFSVSELLANVVKHATATRADVVVRPDSGRIVVVVRDDGDGGARVLPGGGLDGVRRRLAAFDATLEVISPSGGPTTMTVRMPCE
ncbi:sensor histidine kinase [Rathayibacter sp. CAU 1779]